MAVHKKEDGTYGVFLLRCTHMDNEIHLSADGFVCNMHGSTFDKSGNVLKGPAEKPLEQYRAIPNEENLVITP
jgi:Rieske Fe-S protein